jgi:hypothetical protein
VPVVAARLYHHDHDAGWTVTSGLATLLLGHLGPNPRCAPSIDVRQDLDTVAPEDARAPSRGLVRWQAVLVEPLAAYL